MSGNPGQLDFRNARPIPLKTYTTFTDGMDAVTVQRHGGRLHFASTPHDKKPSFIGACEWRQWSDTVAAIYASGLPGDKLTTRQQRLVVAALRDAGILYLFVEPPNGVVPFAKPCDYEPLRGWCVCDLADAQQHLDRRHSPITQIKP